MPANVNIRGAVKLDNFIEPKCFTTMADFIKNLPSMLTVEIPGDITNVTVGTTQPNSNQLDNVWFKTDNSGSFLGIFMFMQGSWQQIYPVPGELIYMTGMSNAIPAGYALVDTTMVSAPLLAFLQVMWHVNTPGPPTDIYDIFHVMYVGF